ncbi:MAG: hypothetical protein BWY75_03571 [bacterium ADurb.Bin425]|nr:MAG: hypothetical protein BWY75_03571 [bacterium ADurb.Bin425]
MIGIKLGTNAAGMAGILCASSGFNFLDGLFPFTHKPPVMETNMHDIVSLHTAYRSVFSSFSQESGTKMLCHLMPNFGLEMLIPSIKNTTTFESFQDHLAGLSVTARNHSLKQTYLRACDIELYIAQTRLFQLRP